MATIKAHEIDKLVSQYLTEGQIDGLKAHAISFVNEQISREAIKSAPIDVLAGSLYALNEIRLGIIRKRATVLREINKRNNNAN